MSEPATPAALRAAIAAEWRGNIRPFWLRWAPDQEFGGFRGHVGHDLSIDPTADKGLILNARILWTFARASALESDAEARAMADRAFAYIRDRFVDPVHGGVYWTVDHRGAPRDTRKKLYAQVFALYGLAEYHRVSGSREALDLAIRLFELIELKGRDRVHGGYGENYDRDWSLSADQRLSEVDLDTRRSMNTHLHVLEAYATLAGVWPDARVREALGGCLDLFLAHILDPRRRHFRMFFDDTWAPQSDVISFGHDIEGSWLLCEAADALGDERRIGDVRAAALRMADAVLQEAVDEEGAVLYEADPSGIIDDGRDWWPQAEAVVGFLNAWQLSGEARFFTAAARAWAFIDRALVDRVHGEWHWRVSREGVPDASRPKLDLWKCPYHNGRMCFEAMHRLTAPAL